MSVALPKIGPGFTLRALTPADAQPLAEIEFNPEVKRFPAQPAKEKANWIAAFDFETYQGWGLEVEGTLAGRASIFRAPRMGEGEIAIVISRLFWSLKLGRKVAAMLVAIAFEELKARALVAQVHPENHASLALLRALRFRRSGLVAPAGTWQDGHVMYRLSLNSYNRSVNADAQSRPAAAPHLSSVAGYVRR